MDILKHDAEVEVKSPQFLLDGVKEQIEAMQKKLQQIKNNLSE